MKFKKITTILLATIMTMSALPFNKVAGAETIDKIEEKIENMTIEEKVGQILMIKVDGWNYESVTGKSEEYEKIVKDYNVGGVILFGSNFINGSKGVAELTNGLQNAAKEPLLVSIDQEGGGVTRIIDGTRMPGNMAMGATDDPKLAEEVYKAMGEEIKAVGANINLGPVSDLSLEPLNSIVSLRSYGSDPIKVSKMVKANIKGMHEAGVMVCAKHFPGQGGTTGDTHSGLTIINQDLKTIEKETIIPFTEGIYSDADLIMPTHSVFPALDDSKIIATYGENKGEKVPTPATYSKKIITNLLRDEIGFDGVVLTDALDMGGATENFTPTDVAINAINAGCDMLLMPPVFLSGDEDLGEFDEFFNSIVDAVRVKKKIKEERLDEALRRILTLKVKNNLYDAKNISLNEQLQNVEKYVGSKSHKELEKKAAEKSITLVKNDNNMLPMRLENNKKVVIIDYNYKQSSMYGDYEWKVNSDSILESMEKILSEQGLKNVNVELSPINVGIKFDDNFNATYDYTKDLTEIFKKIDEADYVILAPYMTLPGVPWYQELDELQELSYYPSQIIDYINSKNKDYVCLNVREPYGIAYMENAKSIVSVYANLGGDMAAGIDDTIRLANIEAGLKVVFGINKPQGKLPINVRKDGESNIQYTVGYGLKFN